MDKFVIEGLKDKLPVVPGINGKEEYFNSAVLVLLMLVNEEYHFVFQKRAANIRQAGEICFPGGKFDPAHDASFRDTAVRETVEELGVFVNISISYLRHIPRGVLKLLKRQNCSTPVCQFNIFCYFVTTSFRVDAQYFVLHRIPLHP